MLANTIPTERATIIEAMTRVRRLRNLRAIAWISLQTFLGRPGLINDLQKNRLNVYNFPDGLMHGISNGDSARPSSDGAWSPGRGLNPGPTAFLLRIQGCRSTTELPGLSRGGWS